MCMMQIIPRRQREIYETSDNLYGVGDRTCGEYLRGDGVIMRVETMKRGSWNGQVTRGKISDELRVGVWGMKQKKYTNKAYPNPKKQVPRQKDEM